MTTVVLKLFEIVRPHVAAFGQKDAQQAVDHPADGRDLMLDVEILVLPTVRDDDGLALSSRNKYLSPEEYEAALAIPRALEAARHVVGRGADRRPRRCSRRRRRCSRPSRCWRSTTSNWSTRDDLEPVRTWIERTVLLLVAARCGETRLLDNEILPAG